MTVVIATREEHIQGAKGLEIFVRSWRPSGEPRAVVLICHGFNSHSGYYAWTAERFAAAGYAVYALDLHGRGQSDGERFFTERYADYLADVKAALDLAKSREPGLPVYILGHSAGGVLSSVFALEHQHELAGLICESFAFRVYAPDFALNALKGLSRLAPRLHVLKLPNDKFSRDPAAVQRMSTDPLVASEVQPTLTVAELWRAGQRLEREFAGLTLPLLILHGTDDQVTKPAGSEMFYERAGSKDKSLKLYAGHYHDLLADTGREEVMRDILAWLDHRAPRPVMRDDVIDYPLDVDDTLRAPDLGYPDASPGSAGIDDAPPM